MTSRRTLAALLSAVQLGCGTYGDSLAPVGTDVPAGVIAAPQSMTLVRVTWHSVQGAAGYRIERREDLAGHFQVVGNLSPGTDTTFDDADVLPSQIYGYRVRSLSTMGTLSDASLVYGAVTPPVPGLVVSTSLTDAGLRDADGVRVRVRFPAGDSTVIQLGTPDSRMLSPLAPGSYDVSLTGLAGNCVPLDSLTRVVTITDQGLLTRQFLDWRLRCRAADRGRFRVHIATTGDSLDTSYSLRIAGVADDPALPDSVRIVLVDQTVGANPVPDPTFENVRPGSYSTSITGIAGNCTLSSSAEREFTIAALSDTIIPYTIECTSDGDNPDLPIVWRSGWTPATAAAGQVVSLATTIDLTALPSQKIDAAQALLQFDSTVVRYDSASSNVGAWQVTANLQHRGQVSWQSFQTGPGEAGAPVVARFWFTVIGTTGQSTRTRSTLFALGDLDGNDLLPQTRRVEGTFTSTSGGGSGNQLPVARAGGPYNGTMNVPLSVSGASSSDPDGSITGYSWTFGDGGSATGMAPTHTYAAAGSYTVTLTVTDNAGATAQSTATAAIAGSGGGGNQPPTARPGSGYAGTSGAAISFDGSGSSDPDGSIATYSWTFGDGGIGGGVAPTHVYPTPGSYTVTLTVTDNAGATGTAQTQATVTGGGSNGQVRWSAQFGTVNPVDSLVTMTITMDLSADLAQTPGAEEIQSWVVDSLKWDPVVLKYFAFNFGSFGSGSVNPTNAAQGKLVFSGAIPSGNGSGLVIIATVRFKAIGAHGAGATTHTRLGPITGTAATGFFSYTPVTTLEEGSITLP